MRVLRQPIAALRRQAWLASQRDAFSQAARERRPQLLIDLSVIARHDARTGIQRVVRAVWTELQSRSHPSYDIVPVHAGASHGYCRLDMTQPPGRKRLTAEVVRVRRGDKFLGLDLAAHYLPHWTEQLTAWKRNGATIHMVVYDCLPLEQPQWFNPMSQRHFQRWFSTVVEHGDQLLGISDAVVRDLQGRIRVSRPPHIGRLRLSGHVASSAPSSGVSGEVARVIEGMARRPAILMVGTVEPRKGHDVALAAFDQLWRLAPATAPDLVIVGKSGWLTADLQRELRGHVELGRRLHWLTDVSDEALTSLYDQCLALLVASRNEGFGLPLSEAACRGKWVLARDLAVFREQDLGNCLFFDDDAPQALARRIEELARLAARQNPTPACLPSWAECVDKLLIELDIDPAPQREQPVEERNLHGAAAR